MITIIVIIAVFAVLWFTKNIWASFLVSMFKKRASVRDTIQTEKTTVFSPSGTTRSFIVAIDITENGDGTVEMSLAKMKQKEVK